LKSQEQEKRATPVHFKPLSFTKCPSELSLLFERQEMWDPNKYVN